MYVLYSIWGREDTYITLLHGNAGGHVGEGGNAGLLESGIPNVLERYALWVGEDERKDFVRVRLQESVNFLQVSLNGSTVEQELERAGVQSR